MKPRIAPFSSGHN